MTKQKDEKPQIDRFKEAARQLEVDESEAAFDEKLKVIAEQKHGGKPPKGKEEEKGE
jgi:hypothetical protein